jgi:hypothetical protein
MRQLENTLIDNSFEDRIINKIDKDKKLTFDKIITFYKEGFLKKRTRSNGTYISTGNPNFSQSDYFDRNMSIFKDKILTNKTWAELGRKYYLTGQRVKEIYYTQSRILHRYAKILAKTTER